MRRARKRGELRVDGLCPRTREPDLDRARDAAGGRCQDEHAVGQVHGLVDVVRHVDDRDGRPSRRVDPQQHVLELGPRQRVDGRERLVEEQQFRAARRARGRSRPAAACRPRAATDTCRPTRSAPCLRAPPRRAPLARPPRARPAQRERDVPADVEPREERTAVVLEDERHLPRRATTGRPSRSTVPSLGGIRPQSMRSSVVFPHPDGPTTASSSPSATSNVTSASTAGPSAAVALPEPGDAQDRRRASALVDGADSPTAP